jgi:peptidoglycan/LPS O-acetylase OafA/YrhL
MFAIGIALYLSIERDLSRPDRPQSHDFLAPLGAIVLTIGFLIATVAGHRTDRMTFAIGFAMVLWCVHGLDEGYRRGLHSESAVIRLGFGGWRILGLMSYSLYLLHGRLQFLADQVCRQVLPAGIARDLAVISMTCASCYVFYRCCERPFIRSRVTAARLEDQTRSPHANATSAVQSLAPVRELPGRTAAHEVIGHGSTSGVARDRSFGARRQQDRASTTAGTSAGDA